MKNEKRKLKVSFTVILSIILCVFVVGGRVGAFDYFKNITPEEFNQINSQLNSQFLGFESHDGVEVHEGATGFADNITPITDDTYDLGSATKEWKDLYIDGTAHIDTLSSGAISTAGDLDPSANNTYDIGEYDKAWKNIYASGTLKIGGTGSESNSTSTIAGSLYLGSGSPSNTTLAQDGSLFVTDDLEVNGLICADNDIRLGAGKKLYYLATTGRILMHNSHQTVPSIGIFTGVSNNHLLIAEDGDFFTDFNHPLQHDPTIFIHSSSTTGAQEYAQLNYNLLKLQGYNDTSTSTYASDFIRLNESETNASGTFYVDSSGNVSASGTITLPDRATSTTRVSCWASNGSMGYCSDAPAATGICTCSTAW